MNTNKEIAAPTGQPGKSLTIASDRLAGSEACLNCGTPLQGPFCYYCGQPDKNMMRFFPALLRELLEDTLDFDSRFARTLKPLLLKPGKLTRDYLEGRRFRYVPPLRLYIFSSIAFFFLAATLTSGAITVSTSEDDEPTVNQQLSAEDQARVDEALKKVDPSIAEEFTQAMNEEDDDRIRFNDRDWDRETNPLIIPLMPDRINNWVNDEIEKSPEKGRQIEDNPNLITDKIFDVLPVTMFILLPMVALLFKFWYLFAKKYYVEHLIFALHNHSFLFVLFLIMMLAKSFADWQDPSEEGLLSTAVSWFIAALWIWIPIYLLVSLKRVYQQRWLLTIGKFSCIGVSYLMLLGLATVIVALTSFVLL